MPRGIETRDIAVSPFRLGDWLIEPDLGHLTRGTSTVHVELRVMDVLVCLALHAPGLVTRKNLTESVWSTEFISDNTLTHAIAELRAAFGDDARNPTYIETIHRRGYRLLASVGDPESKEPAGAERSIVAVIDGDHTVRLRKGENVIGRLPWATVSIDSLQVSRRHARIVVDDTCAVLEDLGSKNGTLLNGRSFRGPSTIEDGDHVAFGNHVVVIQFLDDATTAGEDTPTRPTLEA
jgi:DNA-binding winged helix-turn-helix (wHTH) protein